MQGRQRYKAKTIDTQLATNDPAKMAEALGAVTITNDKALGLEPHGIETTVVTIGKQPIEVNIKTDVLQSVEYGDELFGRKVVLVYLRYGSSANITGGTIVLEPDTSQEVIPHEIRLSKLEGELKDLQYARDNISVDPREKQPLVVVAGELGLEVKGTNIYFKIKGSNASGLTATIGNQTAGFDSKGRVEVRAGNVAKIKAPAVTQDANPRIDCKRQRISLIADFWISCSRAARLPVVQWYQRMQYV